MRRWLLWLDPNAVIVLGWLVHLLGRHERPAWVIAYAVGLALVVWMWAIRAGIERRREALFERALARAELARREALEA